MAVTLIQKNGDINDLFPLSAPFTSANTLGNSIIVAVGVRNGSATTPAVTDTNLNSYSLVVSQPNTVSQSGAFIFRADNIAAGSNTVNVSGPGGGVGAGCEIYETSPLGTTDQTAFQYFASSGTLSLSPVTTGAAGEFCLCVAGNDSGNFYTAGATWTLDSPSGLQLGSESQIPGSAGSLTGQFVAAGGNTAMVLATFPQFIVSFDKSYTAGLYVDFLQNEFYTAGLYVVTSGIQTYTAGLYVSTDKIYIAGLSVRVIPTQWFEVPVGTRRYVYFRCIDVNGNAITGLSIGDFVYNPSVVWPAPVSFGQNTILFYRDSFPCSDSSLLIDKGNGNYVFTYVPSAVGGDYVDIYIQDFGAASIGLQYIDEVDVVAVDENISDIVELDQNFPTSNALLVPAPNQASYTVFVYNQSDWSIGNQDTLFALNSTPVNSDGTWVNQIPVIDSSLYTVVAISQNTTIVLNPAVQT